MNPMIIIIIHAIDWLPMTRRFLQLWIKYYAGCCWFINRKTKCVRHRHRNGCKNKQWNEFINKFLFMRVTHWWSSACIVVHILHPFSPFAASQLHNAHTWNSIKKMQIKFGKNNPNIVWCALCTELVSISELAKWRTHTNIVYLRTEFKIR